LPLIGLDKVAVLTVEELDAKLSFKALAFSITAFDLGLVVTSIAVATVLPDTTFCCF
jgi:hypothetical protein